MDSFPRLLAAGPTFFISSWFLMLIAGAVHTDVGILAFGYPTAMVVTIGLWLAVAPAIGAVAGRRGNPARCKNPARRGPARATDDPEGTAP